MKTRESGTPPNTAKRLNGQAYRAKRGLAVLGDTDGRMTRELRITLQKNVLATGRFDSVDEVLL